MDVADGINAFGQLTGWHLVAFIAGLVVIARPEWLGVAWQVIKRTLGISSSSSYKAAISSNAKADAVDKRLDSHEVKCDKRQAETQAQLDRRFSKVDSELVDLRRELSNVGAKLEKSSEERSEIDAKVGNAIGKIETLTQWVQSK